MLPPQRQLPYQRKSGKGASGFEGGDSACVKAGRFPFKQFRQPVDYPPGFVLIELRFAGEQPLMATFEDFLLGEIFLEGDGLSLLRQELAMSSHCS